MYTPVWRPVSCVIHEPWSMTSDVQATGDPKSTEKWERLDLSSDITLDSWGRPLHSQTASVLSCNLLVKKTQTKIYLNEWALWIVQEENEIILVLEYSMPVYFFHRFVIFITQTHRHKFIYILNLFIWEACLTCVKQVPSCTRVVVDFIQY